MNFFFLSDEPIREVYHEKEKNIKVVPPKLINKNHPIFLLTGELKLGWTWNSALRIFWYGPANILVEFSFHWNLKETPTWLRLCSFQPSPSLQVHLSMGTQKHILASLAVHPSHALQEVWCLSSITYLVSKSSRTMWGPLYSSTKRYIYLYVEHFTINKLYTYKGCNHKNRNQNKV